MMFVIFIVIEKLLMNMKNQKHISRKKLNLKRSNNLRTNSQFAISADLRKEYKTEIGSFSPIYLNRHVEVENLK